MTSSRRFAVPTLAVALAAASLALPGAALARGGGGGGGGGTPAPAPPPAPDPAPTLTCDFSLDGAQPDGSTLSTNQGTRAGCVPARGSGSSLTLYRATDAPRWPHVVTSNGGRTASRVALT